MQLTLVVNRNAGTLRGLDPHQTADQLADIFRAQGHSVTIEVHAGREAVAAILRVCEGRGCDAIVVAGGDGTISAAAAAAAQSGLVLGVLPLGTMNLFARSLGIPLEMIAAAEALATAEPAAVDIGEANGRFFIHHVTLGLHPRMIRARERLNYGSRPGKIWASVQSWWTVLRRPPRLRARIRLGDEVLERRTASILVTNNPLGEGHIPYADDLRQGTLGLYLTTSRRWQDLLQLAARLSMGEIAENPLLEKREAERIEIALPEKSVTASLDGEIVSFQTPLSLRVRVGGLQVLRPVSSLPADSVAAKEGTST